MLRVKSEMKNPKDFMRSFEIATAIYLRTIIMFSILTYRAFGSEMVSPITMNQGPETSVFQQQIFLVAKMLFVFMILSNYALK